MADSLDLMTEAIYEAGVRPALWPSMLDRLASYVGARGGRLMTRSGDTKKWMTSPNLAPVMLEFAEQGWDQHDVRALRCRAAAAHPGFLTDADLMTPDELERLPIYTEFLHPRGLGIGAVTTLPGMPPESLIVTVDGFASHRAARAAVPALDALRPHLARASTISARINVEQAVAATDALASIGTAAAVLTGDARIICANDAFGAWFGGVLNECQGRLRLFDPPSAHQFDIAMQSANRGSGRSIAVRRLGEPQFVLHLVPTLRPAQDLFLSGTVIAVIAVPGASTVLDVDLIRTLYGLTIAEAEVAHRVAAGATPAEAATALGVSTETVRTHLKRAFAKTGAERQAALSSQLRCVTPRRC
ncbi:helix-turn-helix transcriptional regulator [Sphingomonas sp. PB2P19]|uniref:helix-turn-helix transcriptional regulator n=1 Tax=Sphingomonas rhamnosi TaxID=3096156 RepID=UPI002FC63D0B